MVSGGEEHSIQRTATIIGGVVSLELVWAQAREAEKEAAKARDHEPPNRIKMLKRTVREVNPKSVRKWLRRLDDLQTEPLDPRAKYQVGAALLHALLEACPDLVTRKTITKVVRGKPQGRVVLVHTPELADAIMEGHLNEALARPWLLPMVEPPKPWDPDSKRGGYYAIPSELVKSSGQYTHRLEPSDDTLYALNAVQATPWHVAENVLGVARVCAEQHVGPLPYAPLMDMPEAVSKEQWDAMTYEERGAHKAARERVHSHNARTESRRTAVQRTLEVAEEFKTEDRIYFPHSLDWRGRMYPLPQDLNPQGDDLSKSLLRFAEGAGRHGSFD